MLPSRVRGLRRSIRRCNAREQTDAILIGRETAGALLSSQPFDLPDGWRLTIPVHGNWGPDGRDFGDKKVPPHIATTLTRDAVCQGEDVDLAEATRTLEHAWEDRAD